MGNVIQIKRGTSGGALAAGELGLQTSTLEVFIGTASGNKLIGEVSFLKLSGGTMSGAIAMGTNKITGAGDPTAAQDVATKNYVDNFVSGLNNCKPAVKVATTANITLSGTQTIDTYALSAGERVLVKDQTLPKNNGIYVVAAGAWARAADCDSWAELVSCFVWIEQGSANVDTGWLCTVNAGGTLGTTDITWVQFTGAGAITAGAGLTKTGATIDVGGGDGMVIAADGISVCIDTAAGLMFDGSTPKKIQVHIESDHEFSGGGLRLAAYSGGDITKAAGATSATINNSAVTLAKMADLTANTIIGRITASTGVPEALTGTNVRTICGLATTDGPSFDHLHVTIADGTAPLVITSTTKVSNLNVDRVDGVHINTLQDGKLLKYTAAGTIIEDSTIVATDVADAVTKKHAANTDTGTTSMTFQIYSGTSGPILKASSNGGLTLRHHDDAGNEDLKVASLYIQNSYGSTGYISLQGSPGSNGYIASFPNLTGNVLLDVSTIDGGTW